MSTSASAGSGDEYSKQEINNSNAHLQKAGFGEGRYFYRWDIDPTPTNHESPERTDELPTDHSEPLESAVEAIHAAGLKPGPEMPSFDD